MECQEIDISIVRRPWFCEKHKVTIAGGANCPFCREKEKNGEFFKRMRQMEASKRYLKRHKKRSIIQNKKKKRT